MSNKIIGITDVAIVLVRRLFMGYDFTFLRKDVKRLFDLIVKKRFREASDMLPPLYVKHGRTPYVEYLLQVEEALEGVKNGENLGDVIKRITVEGEQGVRRLSIGETAALHDLADFYRAYQEALKI
ncbi:MAG: hypothetical protein QW390_02330 [Candidatus Bathyarchaeia archaeon]